MNETIGFTNIFVFISHDLEKKKKRFAISALFNQSKKIKCIIRPGESLTNVEKVQILHFELLFRRKKLVC